MKETFYSLSQETAGHSLSQGTKGGLYLTMSVLSAVPATHGLGLGHLELDLLEQGLDCLEPEQTRLERREFPRLDTPEFLPVLKVMTYYVHEILIFTFKTFQPGTSSIRSS